MLGSLISGLFGAGASIFQNRANRKAQREQNQFNANQAALDRSFQSAEAEIARDWQEKFYLQYQSPEAMVRQLEAANLNPALMYGSSGPSSGSVPSTSTPSGAQATSSQTYFMDAMNILEAVMKLDGLKAAIDRDKKEGYKAEQEGDKAREEAAGQQIENQFKPDLLRQDLETGKVNIENLKAGIANLNAKTEVEKDQLLNNLVDRRLKEVSADKVVQETSNLVVEQATERLKQKNISVSTEKLASEIILIESERALNVLQQNIINLQGESISLDNLQKQFNQGYRELYHVNPPEGLIGSVTSILFGFVDKIKSDILDVSNLNDH